MCLFFLRYPLIFTFSITFFKKSIVFIGLLTPVMLNFSASSIPFLNYWPIFKKINDQYQCYIYHIRDCMWIRMPLGYLYCP